MNKIKISGPLLALLLCGYPVHAEVYTYVGKPYTKASGPYTRDMLVTGRITTSGPIPSNSVVFDITPLLLSWSFFDGVQTLTPANSIAGHGVPGTNPIAFPTFTTNAAGEVKLANFAAIATPLATELGDRNDLIVMGGVFDIVGQGEECTELNEPEGVCINWGNSVSVGEGRTNQPGTWTIQDLNEIVLKLEEPIDGKVHSGIGNLRGWAVAPEGVLRVEIFIDDKYVYNAPYGGLRVDVEKDFPEIQSSGESGFSLAFGYADLGAGEHTIRAQAFDATGNSVEATSTFEVVTYDQNFVHSNEVVDVPESGLTSSGDEIMIQNVTIGDRQYNLKLKWRTAEQGFEIIEIR
jgi:hypothetical protein